MGRKNDLTEKIDKHVGAMIHELRTANGLSRQQLALEIGVAHQQLQKYEKGTNRVSVGRLLLIARRLRKKPSYFFHNVEMGKTIESHHQRMCIEVSRSFMKIKDPKHQKAISVLIRSLSNS